MIRRPMRAFRGETLTLEPAPAQKERTVRGTVRSSLGFGEALEVETKDGVGVLWLTPKGKWLWIVRPECLPD